MSVWGRGNGLYGVDYSLKGEYEMREATVKLTKIHDVDQQLKDYLGKRHNVDSEDIRLYHVIGMQSR